jgi:hypothetical protein
VIPLVELTAEALTRTLSGERAAPPVDDADE